MNFLTELEDQFSELNHPQPAGNLRVVTSELDTTLENPYLGIDFLSGVTALGLIAIPISKILRISSPNLPVRTEVSLMELLQVQKQPVLLQCSNAANENFWLLNVSDGWLRVATKDGIAWLTLKAIDLVKFSPVDN
jgi:hypothetical protein